ncbi:hypothetical protein D3C75_1212310 [compost metagenome]
MLGQVIAKQIVMHRELERNGELEAFPVSRIAIVLMLEREGNRLAVNVLDCGNPHGLRARAEPHGDGQWHRGEEM